MKKLYILTLIGCWFIVVNASAQVVYNGNGNSGFGDPVGSSSMSISDDGTTITVDFTKGSGNFNDTMVMYIDNGTGGRTVIDDNVNDTADPNRIAISNTGSGDLTFPAGFEATHAIAINTTFGGLWSIPNSGMIGDNGLGYIDAVGMPASTTSASFSFSFDWAEIGLTSSDSFLFVVTYGNPYDAGGMYSSDEGYGTIASGNPGLNAFSITSSLSYPSGLGITDFDTNAKLIISPNPFVNSFSLNKAINKLQIFDLTGKFIEAFKGDFKPNHEFDVSQFSKGLYIVKIENNDGQSLTSKLIKL